MASTLSKAFLGIDPLFAQLAPLVLDATYERPSTNTRSSNQVSEPSAWRGVTAIHPFDVIESPSSYEIHTDAPGLTADEVKIELYESTLTISGEHKVDRKHEEGGKVWRRERTFRKFSRSFVLPDDSKPSEISASLENGVLKVRVPKIEESEKPQPRRIAVAIGGPSSQSVASQKVAGAPSGA